MWINNEKGEQGKSLINTLEWFNTFGPDCSLSCLQLKALKISMPKHFPSHIKRPLRINVQDDFLVIVIHWLLWRAHISKLFLLLTLCLCLLAGSSTSTILLSSSLPLPKESSNIDTSPKMLGCSSLRWVASKAAAAVTPCLLGVAGFDLGILVVLLVVVVGVVLALLYKVVLCCMAMHRRGRRVSMVSIVKPEMK